MRSIVNYANVISTFALFIALSGGAYAATSYVGKKGEITGCVAKNGIVKVKKSGKKCKKGERKVTWSKTGPKGETGAQGLPGAKGDAGAPGLAGAKGETGVAGAVGMQGAPGEQGVQGIQGIPGDIGPQGPAGDKGDPGEPNPNADLLQGFAANELGGRVASGGSSASGGIPTTPWTMRTIAIAAPRAGFVLVNASIYAQSDGASCNPCYAHADLQVDSDSSPMMSVTLGNGTSNRDRRALPLTWVKQVSAGVHQIRLRLGSTPQNSANVGFGDHSINAVFIPFGSNGTTEP